MSHQHFLLNCCVQRVVQQVNFGQQTMATCINAHLIKSKMLLFIHILSLCSVASDD